MVGEEKKGKKKKDTERIQKEYRKTKEHKRA